MTTTSSVSLLIFAIIYIVMFAFQKIRPFAAVFGAAVFVVLGSTGVLPGFHYTLSDALSAVDFNVILMLAGTMGTVSLFIESSMPALLSDILISKTPNLRSAVVALSLFAGLISAFVDNVATVLMIAPVALAFCKKCGISPVAPMICISVSSNLQGAATLVGDTTSVLLSKAAGLDFTDFFVDHGRVGMFFVVEAGALVGAAMVFFMFRREKSPVVCTQRTVVKDKVPTVLLVLTVLSLIAASFVPYKENAAPGALYKPEIANGLICVFFCLTGLFRKMLKERSVSALFGVIKEIDFLTLLLLAGLFAVIGAVSEAGVIKLIGSTVSKLGRGANGVFIVYTMLVWVSVLLSAFIDNIPYTATMLPVVAVIAHDLSVVDGLSIEPKLLYYGLICGATLGGNLTPIGASANIAALGILRKEGYRVSSGEFMKYAVLFTLSAVITGYVLIWLIWT